MLNRANDQFLLCWSAVLLLLVGCATILWFFFGHARKRRRPHKKEIFICSDCWLLVFDFLAPSQLGLGIALISRRFDLYVNEHFKTRKWKLNNRLLIQWESGKDGTMQIVNSDLNPLPIPQNPLTNNIIGFRRIQIIYIDQNVIAFLRRFHRFFAFCSTNFGITTDNDRILEFALLNILPMLRLSVHVMFLNSIAFRRLRQLAPSLLNHCPSLRYVSFDDAILPAFPPDDSANASNGQVMTKWLFTPCPNGVTKFLICNSPVDQWSSSTMEQMKAAFSNASSPVTFCIHFRLSSPIDFAVPFYRINELTGEKLIIGQLANDCCLFRCPIACDKRKCKNVWEEMSARTNPIDIVISDGGYDDRLLYAASPGPSDQQQQKK